ncbi:terminase family protein [Candidatus Pacearchaeota archaeon]|nr:terminase family protein [Candidatus Pacearchaeota archaeon]
MTDEILRQVRVERAKKHFEYFCKQLQTLNEATGEVQPWPIDFKYINDYHNFVERERTTATLKARQLFITNYFSTRFLWNAWRNRADCGKTFNGIVISKTRDDAQEVNRRQQFMFDSMPEEFKLANPLAGRSKSVLEFEQSGRIKIFPASEHSGRAFTATEVLLDEFAFQQNAYSTLRANSALINTGRTKIHIVSTPNGKFNAYYDVWNDSHFKKYELHWSKHPERDALWAKEARKAYLTQEDWDREQELSFVVGAGRRCYPSFSMALHVQNFEEIGIKPIPGQPIYRCWDFGYMHPACVWWQFSPTGQVLVFAEMLGTEIMLTDWVPLITRYSEEKFGKDQWYIDWVDDAGNQTKDTATSKNEKRSIDVLKGYGLRPKSKLRRKKDLLDMVRSLLKPRPDGQPSLIIDSECGCYTQKYYGDEPRRESVLIDGFAGGYVLDSRKLPGGNLIVLDEPFKDGWYDHLQNCLEYGIAGAFDEISRPKKREKPKPKKRWR